MHSTLYSSIVCASVLCLGATGCSSLGIGDDDDGDGVSDVRTTGSRTSVSDLPSGARRVSDGPGSLSYTVKDDGRIYIVDTSTRQVIAERAVEDGDEIRVRPDDDQVEVGGRVVYNGDLKRDNNHAIYFASTEDLDDSRAERNDNLPSRLENADRVASGSGDLSFTAKEDGRIYIWDRTSKEIVYEADIQDGDRLMVSPEQDLISLSNNDARLTNRLNRNHSYEIFFEED